MERLGRWLRAEKRRLAGLMAVVLAISAIGIPVPVMGSEVWPQKSTAPYYCLDGGKGWKASDRYEIYLYNTLPSPLTEAQAKRLFWAYPANWNALKEAAAKYDAELYQEIGSTGSNPNVVKRVKDDAGTKFAWIADNPEIESRAIAALEKVASENSIVGKEVPEPIRNATSEETAASFFVPALCEGPGALDTEFKLSSAFVRDIANIEAQSVWDNGSTGGNVGWLDASQDKNIAKAVLGEELYEITWSGDSIKIHNNGSAVANANVVGGNLSEEQMYNKTTVRYKITMRENSGWYTDGAWNENYLSEWMDFKACVNAPGHQRLYKADIRIVPSDMVFYLVISQGPVGDIKPKPEYGGETADVAFQVYRHEETFESNYNVKLQKVDDETGKSLKGSQFYLYERFEDAAKLGEDETEGGLSKDRISFSPWSGFQIFAEGTTDENGEITYTDTRTYTYSKTYCDGHGMPEWANVSAEEEDTNGDDEAGEEARSGDGGDGENGEDGEDGNSAGAEEARDQNRKAAEQWLALFESCEETAEASGGTHFHWQIDPDFYEFVLEIAESGEAEDVEGRSGASAETAFRESGCRNDCEQTYDAFINLRFTYTWKEVQARNGYILHDVHSDDVPIHFVTTVSSEAGAHAYVSEGSSKNIKENIWYSGNNENARAALAAEEMLAVNERNRKSDSSSERKERKIATDSAWKSIYPIMTESDALTSRSSVSVLSELASGSNVSASGELASGSNVSASDELASGSNVSASGELASGSNTVAPSVLASDSNASKPTFLELFVQLFAGNQSVDAGDDSWEELEGGGDFESYIDAAEEDGIEHLDIGSSDNLSYAGAEENNRKFWIVRDHRTEGEIHINKRDMDLYRGESEDYSSYGDTEGDGTLEGAKYGLFAAEDLVHPDSDLSENGAMTNTGVVYKKNDLVAIAVTDADGNADFFTYTVAPGMTYNYENGQVEKRSDIDWIGPENLYHENKETYGNWWIGRPLLLGSYYIKELSRSEGYELSVNGSSKEWTNYGSGLETPASIIASNGTAIISMPELAATMESEDETGNGYDQLSFTVTSTGTTDDVAGTSGYNLMISGFPEQTEFYRVDSGEMEVTGPHITGTEERIVKDSLGRIVWKTADSNSSHVKYEPEYDSAGVLIGQIPISRREPQIQTFEQIPQISKMVLKEVDVDTNEPLWNQTILETGTADASLEMFSFVKAELEEVLNQNGYDVPVTAEGDRSTMDRPVFSVGVIKGQEDTYGMTTTAGQLAVKTVYGAALQELLIEDVDSSTTAAQVFGAILTWYQEHPQWNFGGLHKMKVQDGGLLVTLYAGVSNVVSRGFFTMREDGGQKEPESVYAVLENAETLRWEYQEYCDTGSFQYQIDKQYFLGSSTGKRYYLDVTIAPAVMIDQSGDRKVIEHQVMVYHESGEEIVDYLVGDPEHGYRVPLTETVDKIEITTEMEFVERDVRLEEAVYDKKTGVHTIQVKTKGEDSFGNDYSDVEQSLSLTFMAKLPSSKKVLTDEDLEYLGSANVYGYQAGKEIGFAEYLMRFTDAAISINFGGSGSGSDTYIVQKRLVYRGQERVKEDGNSLKVPVQVLERPIKQKVKVVKDIINEEAIKNFRFKIYLKSNLERLYRDEDGTITWLDRTGETVDILKYKQAFPELVQKLYTKDTGKRVLEDIKRTIIAPDGTETKIDTYNYEKFFDAMAVANTDKWKNDGVVWNTSWKAFARGLFSGEENEGNTSDEAKENAKRSDAVRQFAVDWYLEDEVETLTIEAEDKKNLQAKNGMISYADEIYDKALYQAIMKAEKYLLPFFQYDLDYIYEIFWDSESGGGIDCDVSTLAANQIDSDGGLAYGVSRYLPYGDYIIVEQQPYKAEWNDFMNRHYEIDTPKELSLPQYFEEDGSKVEPSEVPWSVTEPGSKLEMTGYAMQTLQNKRYFVNLRIEKLDAETGEPILHEDSVFALYKAERNEDADGDGSVKRYEKDTIISGSKMFLEAMGAKNITSFAKIGQSFQLGVGRLYTGTVPAGTPICLEENCVIFRDTKGKQTGSFSGLSTVIDSEYPDVLQTTGYLETPEPVEAGVYVLAEIKVPSGYVRTKPIPVEVYSDGIKYYADGKLEKVAAVSYGNMLDENGTLIQKELETARIYVNDTATSLEVSKVKTSDSYRGMKVSGRVEGAIMELDKKYGLENLELAYNSSGTYLGFGWKKGTLEYLENRKAAGERVQLVYEAGVFQGYGYVTRTLGTSDDENRYVAGAQLALYDAIEVKRSGDSEDFAFTGLVVNRDRNGTVKNIFVKEGYAGEQEKFVKDEEGIWNAESIKRKDTPVLFYDLSNLDVLETGEDGYLYGYDRNGQKMKVTFDTKSIYALRNGQPVFEITGGSFTELVYNARDNVFSTMNENTVIYHLDQNLCRDAQVDGYTGLAYVEKSAVGLRGQEEIHYYVWPIVELKDENEKVFAREKIMTGRVGEKNSGTSQAYITGTVQGESGAFEKEMNPLLNSNGLVEYYPSSGVLYEKGQEIVDRDGESMGYQYDDLLEEYSRAAYRITEDPELYGEEPLLHREGEAWLIPNVWISGEINPQDPQNQDRTTGRADLLRRVVPGTYIMEELNAPEGYIRSMPVAVKVEETADLQKVSMTNEKTKVEIAKVDGTEKYEKDVISNRLEEDGQKNVEGKGGYTGELIENVELALYKAKRVYTADYERYPKGYYLAKEEDTPACWYTENPVDNQPVLVEALWMTGSKPQYFEGIPVGDYILEERWAPEGYLPTSMEITVKETEELQSFIFMNDHTKLEIFKYEEGKHGEKQPLEWPAKAELTLYPALLDSSGEVLTSDEEYLYDRENPIASWKTGSPEEYNAIAKAYESMFYQYANTFEQFSWSLHNNGESITQGSAVLEENDATTNGETITQIWRLNDSVRLRIIGVRNDGKTVSGGNPVPRMVFEYQFQYEHGQNKNYPEIVSYDLMNGIHRLDRIPIGTYILVETIVPEGYESSEPIVVRVDETDAVQRVYFENKKNEEPEKNGTLVIRKVDAQESEKSLSGAWFEVRNLQSGLIYRAVTGTDGRAVLEDLPVRGVYENGQEGASIYEIREIQAPQGYCLDSVTWRIRFDEDTEEETIVYELEVEDDQTEITFSKKDFETGHFVEGAQLAIYEARSDGGTFAVCGEPIETWISTNEPHTVIGKLSGGRTYCLVEESAPPGYTLAKPVRFTISPDGRTITEITENMSVIQVHYQNGSDFITSVTITGRTGIESRNRLYDMQKLVSEFPGTGEPIYWKEVDVNGLTVENLYPGHILNTEETLLFSDGSHMLLERETFRMEEDSRVVYKNSGRYPIGTEYRLFDSEGVRIDKWSLSESTLTHEIINEKNQDGDFLLASGENYYLEEEILFNNGDRILTDRMAIQLGNGDANAEIQILNRESEVRIRKTDVTTGKELPGALIAVKDLNGVILDKWVSGKEEHVMKGILLPGETYILSEMMAADGYAYAEEVQFTVHEDGMIERVIMEDRPTKVQIHKTDMTTGEELPGAKLTLLDEKGEIVDQWISGTHAHVITGKLIAGATYTLIEEMAPQGYLVAEKVTFTVSMDGTIDRVVMEDQREVPQVTQEEGSEPEDTIEPELPEKPKEQEPKEKIGYIVARYEPTLEQSGPFRLIQPMELESVRIPKTGEGQSVLFPIAGMFLSVIGLLWMNQEQRKKGLLRLIVFGIGSVWILFSSCTYPDAVYASEAAPIGVEAQVIHKGPIYIDYKDIEKPESILEQGQEKYRLISTELLEVPVEGTLTYASVCVPYDLEGQQSPPETTVVTLYDERTKSEYKRELTCLDMEEKEVLWEKTFSFPITVSGYDADYFQLGELEIEKEEDLIQYELELLDSMGLSAEDYHIETIVWNGESYEKDGIVMRDAVAEGEKRIRRVEVTYGGEIRTPDTTGYQHVSVYEKIAEYEKDEAIKSDMAMSADKESGQEPVKPHHLLERIQKFLNEHLTVITIGGGFILIIVCVLKIIFGPERNEEERSAKKEK